MHFFRTIIAVCSGPSAFPDLINRNPVRAIFHLFLLSVLLAFAVAALQIAAVKEQRAVISAALSDYFGSVVVGEKTVLPAKHEKERKTFILTRQLRLDYLPDSAELLKGIGDWRERTGIVWTPRGFLLWSATEAEPGKYMLVPMPFPSNAFSLAPFMDSPAPLTAEEIEEYVQKNYFSGAADAVNKPSASIPVANLTAAAFAVYNAFIGFAAFTGLFFTALVASLLFAGAQSIFCSARRAFAEIPANADADGVCGVSAVDSRFAGVVACSVYQLSNAVFHSVLHLSAAGVRSGSAQTESAASAVGR